MDSSCDEQIPIQSCWLAQSAAQDQKLKEGADKGVAHPEDVTLDSTTSGISSDAGSVSEAGIDTYANPVKLSPFQALESIRGSHCKQNTWFHIEERGGACGGMFSSRDRWADPAKLHHIALFNATADASLRRTSRVISGNACGIFEGDTLMGAPIKECKGRRGEEYSDRRADPSHESHHTLQSIQECQSMQLIRCNIKHCEQSGRGMYGDRCADPEEHPSSESNLHTEERSISSALTVYQVLLSSRPPSCELQKALALASVRVCNHTSIAGIAAGNLEFLEPSGFLVSHSPLNKPPPHPC